MSIHSVGKGNAAKVTHSEEGNSVGSSRPFPNFFVVGQPKTGSTALHAMLRQHPDVYMPEFKEPHFFCTDLYETDRHDHIHPRTLDEYLSLFAAASCAHAIGEASSHYLRSHAAAGNLHEFNADARIVVMLREPATLLRSLHLELVRLRYEPIKDLRTALALERERKEGRCLPPSSWWPQDFRRSEILQYSEHVRYVDQLERYREVFSPANLMVLIYDDFRRDNHEVLRKIFRFLGVDDGVDIRVGDARPSSSLRSERVLDVLHGLSTGSGVVTRSSRQAIKAITPRRLRGALFVRLTMAPPPPVDEAFMAELRHLYAPEVRRLSEYLGRDLVSLWQAQSADDTHRARG